MKNKQSYNKRNELVIQTKVDLRKITIQRHSLIERPHRLYFSLQLPYLSEDQNRYYEQKLSKSYSACGCKSGAALGLIALVVFATIFCLSSTYQWSWMVGLYGIGVFSLGVVVGKITGLTRANLRVKRIIKTLTRLAPNKNASHNLNRENHVQRMY